MSEIHTAKIQTEGCRIQTLRILDVLAFGTTPPAVWNPNWPPTPKYNIKISDRKKCLKSKLSGNGTQLNCLKSKLVQISDIHCILIYTTVRLTFYNLLKLQWMFRTFTVQWISEIQNKLDFIYQKTFRFSNIWLTENWKINLDFRQLGWVILLYKFVNVYNLAVFV